MALSTSAPSDEIRSFSVGPVKVQILNWAAASADVSGTITADRLSSVSAILIPGLELTAAPTYSGNVVTLAFTDPGATVAGMVMLIGR